jgi:hypothetical protein
VTIEILNRGGTVIRHYSSSDPAPVVDVNTLAVNLAWSRLPEPLSAAAGMHRWVWDFRPDPPAAAVAAAGRGARRRRAVAVAVRRRSRRAPTRCA